MEVSFGVAVLGHRFGFGLAIAREEMIVDWETTYKSREVWITFRPLRVKKDGGEFRITPIKEE